MASISSMISFFVLLLATYSYSAPIIPEGTATVEYEVINATFVIQSNTTEVPVTSVPSKSGSASSEESHSNEVTSFPETTEVHHRRGVEELLDSTVTGLYESSTVEDSTFTSATGTAEKRDMEDSSATDMTDKRDMEESSATDMTDKRDIEESSATAMTDKRDMEESATDMNDKRDMEDSSATDMTDKRDMEESSATDMNDKRDMEDSSATAMTDKRDMEESSATAMTDKRTMEESSATDMTDKRDMEESSATDMNDKRGVEESSDSTATDVYESSTTEDSSSTGVNSGRIVEGLLFTTMESVTEFNQRAIRPVSMVEEKIESSTGVSAEYQPEMSTDVQPSSSVDSFVKYTGLLQDQPSTTYESETTSQVEEDFTTESPVTSETATKILSVIPGTISKTKIIINRPTETPVVIQQVDPKQLTQVGNQSVTEETKSNN